MSPSARTPVILAALAALVLQGCDGFHAEARSVGGRTFRVPTRYLVKGSVPWLPRSPSAGLVFALDPKSALAQQHIVLVQEPAKICPSARIEGGAPSVCRMAAPGQAAVAVGPFEKAHPYGDLSQWDYRSSPAQGASSVVASCYALGDASGDGLCTALQPYRSLVYLIGFRDSEIAQLPVYEKQATELLSRWDKSR